MPEQEAAIVAFRRYTLLPLDECLYALPATIPGRARSALHRCFQRHGISRLPLLNEKGRAPKKNFTDYPIGYLRVDFAEPHTEEGTQCVFVASDRTSKGAFAELQPRATWMIAADFLHRALPTLPDAAHKVLPDNDVQCLAQPHHFLPGGHSQHVARANIPRIYLRPVAKEPQHLYPRPGPTHLGTVHLARRRAASSADRVSIIGRW